MKTALKPGGHRDKYSPYIRIAAVCALSKGANKKAIADLLKCTPATLSNWQRAARLNLDFWRYPGRDYTFRGCSGCTHGNAHKGRRAAICLLCNGATYEDVTKVTGQPRRVLWGYLKAAPQCTPPGLHASAPGKPSAGATVPDLTPAEMVRETMRATLDDLATLTAELSETAAPDYLRPQLDNITQLAAALLSMVE